MQRPKTTFPILILALLLTAATFLRPAQVSLGCCVAVGSSFVADPHDGCEETIAPIHARPHHAPRAQTIAQPAAAPTHVTLPPLA